MAGAEVRRLSLRSQVLAIIRQALVSGEMVPGVVYSTPALAAQFGVSNAPVREAMLALADDGLLEVVPNRGFRVIPLDDRDLAEIVELRMMLEVSAAAQLAERAVPAEAILELRRLAERIKQHVGSGEVPKALEADREFHLALVGLCGNQLLTDTVARLRDRTRLYNLRILARNGQLTDSAAEHDQIVDAIARHDRPRTEAVMRQHLMHILADWSSVMPGGTQQAG